MKHYKVFSAPIWRKDNFKTKPHRAPNDHCIKNWSLLKFTP